MYKPVKSKTELLHFLNEFKAQGKDVILHYRCVECNDEQVTYPEEVTESQLVNIEKNNSINIGLECTHCMARNNTTNISNIIGVEI